MPGYQSILENVKFDKDGLVCAIIQDAETSEVLMVGYMNKEALLETLTTKRTCFWSRSRQQLWRKGDTSGHIQKVKEVYIDCDGDALLFKVEQVGGACHTGFRSCFYRRVNRQGNLSIASKKVFDPKKVYKK